MEFKVRANTKKGPELSASAADQDLITNLFQKNPGTDRITLKLHLILKMVMRCLGQNQQVRNDLGNWKLVYICRLHQSQLLGLNRSKTEQCMGSFFVLTDGGTIVNIRIWFTQVYACQHIYPRQKFVLKNKVSKQSRKKET